jgi:hypothetical protein
LGEDVGAVPDGGDLPVHRGVCGDQRCHHVEWYEAPVRSSISTHLLSPRPCWRSRTPAHQMSCLRSPSRRAPGDKDVRPHTLPRHRQPFHLKPRRHESNRPTSLATRIQWSLRSAGTSFIARPCWYSGCIST